MNALFGISDARGCLEESKNPTYGNARRIFKRLLLFFFVGIILRRFSVALAAADYYHSESD